MTKRFLKATFIIAFVIITGQIAFNAQSTNASNIDELTLENIEALGTPETGTDPSMPSTYPAYTGTKGSGGTLLRYKYTDGTCHMTLLRNATRDGSCRNE